MDLRPASRLDELYKLHAERLWRAVFAYTGDREVTNDAVAEAFAQCLRRGKDVRYPKAWLWQAAFHVAAGEMNRRGTLSELREDLGYEMPEKAWALLAALGSLPSRQRAVLVLYYYAGYRTGEIASIVGSSTATVRVHLSRGRKRLRQLLEEDDG